MPWAKRVDGIIEFQPVGMPFGIMVTWMAWPQDDQIPLPWFIYVYMIYSRECKAPQVQGDVCFAGDDVSIQCRHLVESNERYLHSRRP